MADTGSMPAPLPSPFRKVLVLAVSAGLLAGATPSAALAGGGGAKVAKPPKCDPLVDLCNDGRKNG